MLSHEAVKQVIEPAVTRICCLQEKGLWFSVDAMELSGRPLDRIRIWATLHFLPRDKPYCCGEPGCHLGLIGDRLSELNDAVRYGLRLADRVTVEFENRIAAKYYAGVVICDESS